MFVNRNLIAGTATALLLCTVTLSADAVAIVDADGGKTVVVTPQTRYVTSGSSTLWDVAMLVLGLVGTILAIDALVQARSARQLAQEAKTIAEEAKRLALRANANCSRSTPKEELVDAHV